MPVKIGFRVVSSSGEDEKFRATELNYHGPTVRGWRSVMNCAYPQEIILQLKMLAILQQIQILAHQYLIPQKVEICTSSRMDWDTVSNNSRDFFEYLGFITFSDNKATGFRSRELKSILIPSKKAKYVKLRILSNHENAKNVYNQVGLMAINIIGDALHYKTEESEMNNNINFHPTGSIASTVHCNFNYISPYDDLAFEMSVDQETAKIMKIIEFKMLRAVFEERLDYANALKITLENLRAAGEILGIYEQEKRRAINLEDYDRAKSKKFQIDNFRQKIYNTLHIDELLESVEPLGEYDVNSNVEEKPFSNGDTQIENGCPEHDQINDRVVSSYEPPEYEKSPSRTPFRPPPNQMTHSHSHTSFRGSPSSPAFFKPRTFSTSVSNPHLHQTSKETPWEKKNTPEHQPRRQKLDASLEQVRTPSTASDSLSEGELSPPEELSHQVVYDWSGPLVPLRETRIGITEGSPNFSKSKCSPSKSPQQEEGGRNRLKASQCEHKIRSKSVTIAAKSSFEAYEDRMLPALRSFHGNEVVRECQLVFDQQRKSTLNERERKQAMLPISVFGIEMIEKFYSKSFNDKEEGLKQLQQELKRCRDNTENESSGGKPPSYNKIARATTFLLHRALRDKVYSVYSCAAETIRLFFADFVPQRVSPAEIARSVEKLLPELLVKSGDVTPRIHNMAAHTLLSMAECEEVRRLNIIPAQLSRPLASSVHPRLALSRLEMVEQLILNHGISKEKKSGLTCRTLAEFGSSGLHHPAEAVRKVSERILIHVYKVNPRIVRKQLPPDDNVTRRNLLYRQLFQEFDFMDVQRKLNEQDMEDSKILEVSSQGPPPSQTEENKKPINQGFSLLTEEERNIKIKDPNVEAIKNLLSLNTIERNKPGKKPTVAKLPQEHNEIPIHKGQRPKELSPGKNKEKEVKFPSLTDSIQTTKARMMLEQKSPKFSLTKGQNFSLTKKDSKRDNQASGIPIPTFGPRRKLPVKEQPKQISQTKLPKPIEGIKTQQKTIKIKMFDSMEEEKREATDIKREMLENLQRNVCSLSNNEDSIKFSDSMLASIRENEFTASRLFSETALKTCIFCLSSKEWTTEDSLNRHYLRDCMMLTTCEYCMEVTEISGFNNHLLVDCKWKHIFQKCGSCKEAILKDLYNRHECTAAGGKVHKSRCPFCHTTIGDEDSSWRKHLTGKNTCANHPRQKESGLSL